MHLLEALHCDIVAVVTFQHSGGDCGGVGTRKRNEPGYHRSGWSSVATTVEVQRDCFVCVE